MKKLKIKKEYRFACACGCDSVCVASSERTAERNAHRGSIEEVWAVVESKGKDERVVADAYTREDAVRVRDALRGA